MIMIDDYTYVLTWVLKLPLNYAVLEQIIGYLENNPFSGFAEIGIFSNPYISGSLLFYVSDWAFNLEYVL